LSLVHFKNIFRYYYIFDFINVKFPNELGFNLFLRSVSMRPALENRHSDGTDVAVIDKIDLATFESRGKDLCYT